LASWVPVEASWAAVGEALGVGRQSAWQYFTRRASSELAANVAENTDLTEDEAIDPAVEEVPAVRRSRRALAGAGLGVPPPPLNISERWTGCSTPVAGRVDFGWTSSRQGFARRRRG
jgi:hypothetical protein